MAKKQKKTFKKLTKKIRSGKTQAFLGGVLATALGQLLSDTVELASKKLKVMQKLQKKLNGKGRHHDEAAPAMG